MNWTGGSLQRTKNANKGVLQKQKAYFARSHTHPQNDPGSNAIAFKPSYALQDKSPNLTRYLQAEKLTEPRRDSLETIHLLRDHASGHMHCARDSPACDLRTRCVKSDGYAAQKLRKHGLADSQKAKRKRDDTSMEIGLLEAKRKQLLKKRDWIGVAPSRPLLPSFLASKEGARIVKRRRVRGSEGKVLRHRDCAGAAARSSRFVGDQFAGAIVKTRNPNHLNGIRIRIGTDALTTVASTKPSHDNQSCVSSESMLFDQQTHDAERLDAPRSAKPMPSLVDAVKHTLPRENNHVRLNSQWADGQLQHDCTARAGNSGEGMGLHRSRRQTVRARVDRRLLAKDEVAREQSCQQLQITQYGEGMSRAFRYVFGSSNSSECNQCHSSIRELENGGTKCACDAAHAGGTKKRHMHEFSDKPRLPFESEAATASAIVDVDEAVWKSVLGLAEQSSSQTRASNESEASAVHAHPKGRSHEVEHYSWSQHATQGDRTRIGSSLIPASLHSLELEVQLNTDVHNRANNTKHRNLRTNTLLDQEEQLWQDFVFGSGEAPCSGEGHDLGSGSIQCWKPWSGVPPSITISPVSTTPFRAMHVPHTTDDVHDTATFARLFGARTIPSSAATAGAVDKVCDGEGERSAFARESVTHSSLLNNASGETNFDFSGMSGRTETSRGGLEHTDRSRDSLLEYQAWSSPRRVLYGNSDTDDGVDLVDPDRIL
ncbi:hypothetical protein DE146DRAFT_793699 [Phaeosphaeria sp. MPI-PUGE-AT-0046c]|nr:hypothetical protein DE146DRAFT_793699 [Phaeosphaeria sp. MPI-PUGE-AT-0046c]